MRAVGRTVGDMLHRWRAAQRGRTWAHLARVADVPESWLRSVASDKIRRPDAVELRRVAEATGLDYRELLDATGQTELVGLTSALDPVLRDLMEDQTRAIRESALAQTELARALGELASALLSEQHELARGQEELAVLLGDLRAALDRAGTPSGSSSEHRKGH